MAEHKFLKNEEYSKNLTKLVDEAKQSICILMFDWRWYEHDPACEMQKINQSLVRAARRGVFVRAYTQNDYVQKTLLSVGIHARKHKGKNLLHTKLVIIDDKTVILGSHNFSNSAMRSNDELSVCITDPYNITIVKEKFERIWQS